MEAVRDQATSSHRPLAPPRLWARCCRRSTVVDLTYEEICAEMKRRSEGDMKGILGYTEESLVSTWAGLQLGPPQRLGMFLGSFRGKGP